MGDIFNVDPLPIPIQDLDESAHVCPFEVMWQVHIHVYGSDGVLGAILLIQYGNRVTDTLHPNLVDFNVTVVFLILDVNDWAFAFLTAHEYVFLPIVCSSGFEDSGR
jgi:hypothetical protein